MKKIVLSEDIDTVEEWKKRDPSISATVSDTEELSEKIEKDQNAVVLVDYDSSAHALNKLIASNKLPPKTIVLERSPEIATGKMLLRHGVKGYGNSAMLPLHYDQMIRTVLNGDIWTYPELTAALTKKKEGFRLTQAAKDLLRKRLSPKEKEVVFLILEGLTNEAIAEKLGVSIRTVKAHVSSIFEKLHVNDRLSLALLLLQS